MSPKQRLSLVLAAVIAIAVLFVVAQPSDDSDDQADRPAAATPDQATTDGQPASSGTPADPKPPVRVDRITIQGGQPVGGVKDIEIRSGKTFRLAVRSDVADEVHIHGYDRSAPVAPKRTAFFRFKVDAEGIFEIELENSAVPIARLKVVPG